MSYPSVNSHSWAANFVGGSSNDPVILHLEESNLITNGSFEDVLSNWSNESGTAPSRVDEGSDAPNGNYVMRLQASSIIHQAIAFTGTKILLTGFVKFVSTDASGSFDIDLYVTDSDSYVASPASKYISVTINSEDSYVDASGYYAPFYAELECTAGTHVHINFGCDSGVEVYIDDLKLYEVNESVTLYEPNTLKMRYQYVKDAEYTMFDGEHKVYSRGWRPIYTIGYDYVDSAGLVKNIGLTESLFNFFIPHSNNLSGWYVRANQDYSVEPFHNRFIGHSDGLELFGIFLVKNKFREYGESYFSASSD